MKTSILLTLILVACTATAVDRDTIPLAKPQAYRLQASVAKTQLAQLKLQLIHDQWWTQVLASNAEAKQLKAQADDLLNQQDALVNLLFDEAKLTKTEYFIDPDKGEFRKVPKTK